MRFRISSYKHNLYYTYMSAFWLNNIWHSIHPSIHPTIPQLSQGSFHLTHLLTTYREPAVTTWHCHMQKKKSFSFSFFTNSKWKKRSQGMRIKERVKSTIWQKFILLSSQRRGRCLTVHSIIWQHWQWFVTLSVSCIPPLKIWWNLLNYCKFC